MWGKATIRLVKNNFQLRFELMNLIINDYDPIASVFDEIMGEDFIAAVDDFRIAQLSNILARKPLCRVLDLCCGTGLFLCRIAGLVKIDGIGIDLSAGQLEVASARVQAEVAPARLVRGDILSTDFPPDCDLVTINFDSLNHLRSLDEWKSIFAKAFNALIPGGSLAFDLNTPERLQSDWSVPEVIVKKNVTYLQVGLKAGCRNGCVTRKAHMIIFKRRGDLFERMSALVEHMAVPNDKIKDLLHQAGFSRVSWFFASREQCKRLVFLKNRAFFLAQK